MPNRPDDKAIAIIPARLGSTRFPRKALADETGKPMVVHVCEQAAKAESVNRVVVATDAEEIKSAVEIHGFEAVMTSVEHTNGTSRLAEASELLSLHKHQVIINVQGDEPEINPSTIDAAFDALCPIKGPSERAVGTVVCPIDTDADFENPNVVKAVMTDSKITRPAENDEQISIGKALYFSRSPVPYPREQTSRPSYRHVGIYAYTSESIMSYLTWKPSSLERTESLEQLRWLDHDHRIYAAIIEAPHTGIDTPEQYRSFVERFKAAQS
ncbi:MAG: 3-deoxy-manno-octulosonate cytidylyltransferase [Phycisphaerales bacterium]|nr:3-deoxy-manno-octulosonate cytidylyltransferase [Phycisphaerales bacterium]